MGSEVDIIRRSRSGRSGSHAPVKVMIVDDSVTIRAVLSRVIDSQPDLEVVAKPSSAELALKELERTKVDVVLLDLEMPGMGGLGALPRILEHRQRVQVLVVSSLTEEGAEPTLAALSMGAADTMAKPRSGGFGEAYCEALYAKIRALAPGRGRTSLQGRRISRDGPLKPPARRAESARVVAIGASTGGIHAMCLLLRNLSPRFDLPIIVTQHLPDTFMTVFARQLELASGRRARVAKNGDILESRTIYIAPGDGHLEIVSKGENLQCKISRTDMPSGFMPSVDPMLESLAEATDGRAIGIILSGMGRDGSIGAARLVKSGGVLLAQDEDSSAVWGMPRTVHERGLALATLPPTELAQKLLDLAGARAWK